MKQQFHNIPEVLFIGLVLIALEVRSQSVIVVDCTLSSSKNVCTNAADPSCATFVYDEDSGMCVDCSIGYSLKCLNQYVTGCNTYQFDLITHQCYDCSIASNGLCTNGSYSTCKYFVFDSTSQICIDCSIADVPTSSCVNVAKPGCGNYSYDPDLKTCFDCSLTDGEGGCFNYNIQPFCQNFSYDVSSNSCLDCSVAVNGECPNQHLPGCSTFRYYAEGNQCVDCTLAVPERSKCIYNNVPGCPPHFFDLGSFTCITCTDLPFWTDAKCYACFQSTGMVQAKVDQTGCQLPDDTYYSIFAQENYYTFSPNLNASFPFLFFLSVFCQLLV